MKMHAVIPPRASEIHLISSTEPISFKLPDSLDSTDGPRDLDPTSDQMDSDSFSRDVTTDSSLDSVSPPSTFLQSTSSLLVSLFTFPLLSHLFSAFAPTTGSSLRGVHPDENAIEQKQNKNRIKRHQPTVYPTGSSSPTASPSYSPTSTSTSSVYPSSIPSLISSSVSPSHAISDTTISSALSSPPSSTSTIPVPDSTSTPSADSRNTTGWYEEKGKEEENAVLFQDTAVTQYFMNQITCMQGKKAEISSFSLFFSLSLFLSLSLFSSLFFLSLSSFLFLS